MFNKWLNKKIESRLIDFKYDFLEKYIEPMRIDIDKPYNFKICEKCGCLLSDEAIKGKPIIKQKFKFDFFYPREEDYIHTPYYCKIHAPKK